MNGTLAITRNRDALLRIVAMLFAAVGLREGGAVASVPRHVRSHILRWLLPAESAARRLIVMAARGLSAPSPVKRPAPAGAIPQGSGARMPAFALNDPRPPFRNGWRSAIAGPGPRITAIGFDDRRVPGEAASSPGDPVPAARLCRRLLSLQNALDDLPKQARRLLKARARRERDPLRTRQAGLLRIGRPPGHRARKRSEIDTILHDCHALALYASRPPDT